MDKTEYGGTLSVSQSNDGQAQLEMQPGRRSQLRKKGELKAERGDKQYEVQVEKDRYVITTKRNGPNPKEKN